MTLPTAPAPSYEPPTASTFMAQPLVLTVRLDRASEKLLTSLRTKYFPSHRNFLPAHITLFHTLPASSTALYTNILSSLAAHEAPFTVGIKAPFALGKKGVGVKIASHKLRVLHQRLLDDLQAKGVQLTEQDARRLSAHVTVQNKVGEEQAKRTLEELRGEWEERAGRAEGVVLWRYENGGEWTFLKEFVFGGGES